MKYPKEKLNSFHTGGDGFLGPSKPDFREKKRRGKANNEMEIRTNRLFQCRFVLFL